MAMRPILAEDMEHFQLAALRTIPVVGTDLHGSGLAKTSDESIFLERTTYFNRETEK